MDNESNDATGSGNNAGRWNHLYVFITASENSEDLSSSFRGVQGLGPGFGFGASFSLQVETHP